VIRHDYAYPFHIDPASHQAAQAEYVAHVRQMIRQVLLTAPGERVNLPEFGCGLRKLLFAPYSDALVAATTIQVQRALDRWLSAQIRVREVFVQPPEDASVEGQLLIRIAYELIETRTHEQMELLVV
jgi:phage baseplate assembly protein W